MYVQIKKVRINAKSGDDLINTADIVFGRPLKFSGSSFDMDFGEFERQLKDCFEDVFEKDEVEIRCDLPENVFPEGFEA